MYSIRPFLSNISSEFSTISLSAAPYFIEFPSF
jgi:hypothetical protein